MRVEEKMMRVEEKMMRGEEKMMRGEEKMMRGEEKMMRGEEKMMRGEEKIMCGEEKIICGEEEILLKIMFSEEIKLFKLSVYSLSTKFVSYTICANNYPDKLKHPDKLKKLTITNKKIAGERNQQI